ncbi:MAG: hypothetical protein L0H41_01975 [Microlunatus sp.]|nr:hypothetical protein [Microlunatus sp.]
MQPWLRWREPLAVTLLVALIGMLAIRSISLAIALPGTGSPGFLWAIPGGDSLLLLATTAAVVWCTTPVAAGGSGDGVSEDVPEQSPHAYPIAVAGLLVVGFTVTVWAVLAVWDLVSILRLPAPAPGFVLPMIEGVVRLVVPLAALMAAVLAFRRAADAHRTREQPAAVDQPRIDQPEIDHTAPDDPAAASASPDRLPAAWQADEAAGAVWLTADDAAEGRPGLSWSGDSEPSTDWASDPTIDPPDPDLSPDPRDDPGQPGSDDRPQETEPSRSSAEDDDLR